MELRVEYKIPLVFIASQSSFHLKAFEENRQDFQEYAKFYWYKGSLAMSKPSSEDVKKASKFLSNDNKTKNVALRNM